MTSDRQRGHRTRLSIMWRAPWQSGRSASCPCFYQNLGPAKHSLSLHKLFEAEHKRLQWQVWADVEARDGQSDVHLFWIGALPTCNLHACKAGSGISGPQPEPSKLQACSSPEDREAYRVSSCCSPWSCLAQLSAKSMRSSTFNGCSCTASEMLSSPQPSKVRSRSASRHSLHTNKAKNVQTCQTSQVIRCSQDLQASPDTRYGEGDTAFRQSCAARLCRLPCVPSSMLSAWSDTVTAIERAVCPAAHLNTGVLAAEMYLLKPEASSTILMRASQSYVQRLARKIAL